MQGQKELAKKNAGPDSGTKAKSEGEGDGLRSKKDRGDEDVVHLGQKTQPAGEGVENPQHQGGTAGLAEPEREVEKMERQFQGKFKFKIKIRLKEDYRLEGVGERWT
jgi:hypothetical protein